MFGRIFDCSREPGDLRNFFVWPDVGWSGSADVAGRDRSNEGLARLPAREAPLIVVPVNAAPVSAVPFIAVLTNSRRVTLRDMRRILILVRSKDNEMPGA